MEYEMDRLDKVKVSCKTKIFQDDFLKDKIDCTIFDSMNIINLVYFDSILMDQKLKNSIIEKTAYFEWLNSKSESNSNSNSKSNWFTAENKVNESYYNKLKFLIRQSCSL